MKRTIISLAIVALLGACASPITQRAGGSRESVEREEQLQRELAARQYADDLVRAGTVYGRLRVAAAGLCAKDVGGVIGMMAGTSSEKPEGQALSRVLGVGSQPTVWAVFPGGPASEAGIGKGDVIVAVEGQRVPDQKALLERFVRLAPGVPVALTIQRAGIERAVTFTPQAGCKYPLMVTQQQTINAYADGERIIITQGMVNFARTDEELSLVIAHEMAHNLMKHIDAKKTNAAGGLLADVALSVLTKGAYRNASMSRAAGQAYSQEFEAEADYVGLYILAMAGVPIAEAPKFWRRMAVAHPGNIKTNHAASHPSTASRMVSLDAAVDEINAKIADGLPLEPNVKAGAFIPPASK